MKRREFSVVASAVLAASVLPVSVANAQAKGFSPGFEYKVMDPRAPVDSPAGKVEVVEFFSYMCPHCNVFEPAFHAWTKRVPADVVVRRIPVGFLQNAEVLQRLYFTLEAMGLVDKLHAKVFAAIHVEKLNLSKAEAIVEWVGKNGVDKAKFVKEYNSFGVVTKAQKGSQLQSAYKVEGVPALGVGGQFYTDGSMARSMERALLVVQSLVDDLRGKRA